MFDATTTQTNLNKLGSYNLVVDGIAGPATFAALMTHASQRGPLPLAHDLAVACCARLDPVAINTPLRVRHFLAQGACETDGFTRLKEQGDAAYFQRYEMRRDLGNIHPGDGAKYCGRGWLDTTGLYNYTVLAGISHLDCVNHPELLENPDDAVWSGALYWESKGVNAAADASDIRQVTLLINGGYNGLADRMTYCERLGVIQP